jgi:hypothetical protein
MCSIHQILIHIFDANNYWVYKFPPMICISVIILLMLWTKRDCYIVCLLLSSKTEIMHFLCKLGINKTVLKQIANIKEFLNLLSINHQILFIHLFLISYV